MVVADTEVAEGGSGMVATHRVLDRVNCIDRDKTYLTTNVVVYFEEWCFTPLYFTRTCFWPHSRQ